MQDAEFFAFMAIFRELLKVFPKRTGDEDVEPLAKAYFRALQRFTIPQIQAGADVYTQRGKFFPKPAEWRDAIPRAISPDHEALSELLAVDAAEYLDAERRRFEGDPCACRRCQGAGVTHRLLRFVPEQDERGLDVRGLIGTRAVVRGHWAHGYELAQWYAVRDAFWVSFAALVAKLSMPQVKAEPEPVEEMADAS